MLVAKAKNLLLRTNNELELDYKIGEYIDPIVQKAADYVAVLGRKATDSKTIEELLAKTKEIERLLDIINLEIYTVDSRAELQRKLKTTDE